MEVNDKVLNIHLAKNNLNKRDSKGDGRKRRVKEKNEEISEEKREMQMNNLIKWREKMARLNNKEYSNESNDNKQVSKTFRKEHNIDKNTKIKEEKITKTARTKKKDRVVDNKKENIGTNVIDNRIIDKIENVTENVIENATISNIRENIKTNQIINRIENGIENGIRNGGIKKGLEAESGKEKEVKSNKEYKIDKEKMEEIRREIKKSGLKKEYEPYDHQIEAIEWMRKTIEEGKHEEYGIKGGILHMSMGLGKTLTTLLHCLLKRKKGEGPTLIVCSKSLMPMWEKDGVKKFFEEKVRCLCMHKEYVKENLINLDYIMSFDFIVTTYDFCLSVFNKGNYINSIEAQSGKGNFKYNVYQCRNSSNIKYPTSRLCDLYSNNSKVKKNNTATINKKTGYKINNNNTDEDVGYKLLYEIQWSHIILDESQRIVNPTTKIYKAMLALCGTNKFCLTGTPIKNSEVDFWSHLMFLGYKEVLLKTDWSCNYVNYIKMHNLRDIIFSKSMDDTDIKLPPKLDKMILIDFKDKIYNQIYIDVLDVIKNVYKLCVNKQVDYICVLSLFTRLRQICLSPYLISPQSKRSFSLDDNDIVDLPKSSPSKSSPSKSPRSPRSPSKFFPSKFFPPKSSPSKSSPSKSCVNTDDFFSQIQIKYGHLISNKHLYGYSCPKIIEIAKIIDSTPSDDKIIIYSSFVGFLDLIADFFNDVRPDITHLMIDGSVSVDHRSSILSSFSSSPVKCLLMTYKTGSEGLNITCANHVICSDTWWNHVSRDQGVARAWRPGQTKPVTCYTLVIQKTIEQKMLDMCNNKRLLSHKLLSDESVSYKKTGISLKELSNILDI
mgnify:CR=1 FL=1